ncbi:MAG: HAD-IIIA family hydrolase [Synergistaceae bacterium]|nr:HAD-IIIA family hydrolase [Synergistaceae bacterium]
MSDLKKPAVFLDRDGVITIENFAVTHPKSIKVMPFVASCINELHNMGYLVLVITNQSGIARGLFTINELEQAHKLIIKQTGIDDIFYCPHYIHGKVKEFSVECNCRKPRTGLINQALSKYHIDMSKSYMVGDRASDIMTGQNVGIRTVLLDSGYGRARLEQYVAADHYFADLRDFVRFLEE